MDLQFFMFRECRKRHSMQHRMRAILQSAETEWNQEQVSIARELLTVKEQKVSSTLR